MKGVTSANGREREKEREKERGKENYSRYETLVYDPCRLLEIQLYRIWYQSAGILAPM